MELSAVKERSLRRLDLGRSPSGEPPFVPLCILSDLESLKRVYVGMSEHSFRQIESLVRAKVVARFAIVLQQAQSGEYSFSLAPDCMAWNESRDEGRLYNPDITSRRTLAEASIPWDAVTKPPGELTLPLPFAMLQSDPDGTRFVSIWDVEGESPIQCWSPRSLIAHISWPRAVQSSVCRRECPEMPTWGRGRPCQIHRA